MPVHVEHRPSGSKPPWAIVENSTGKIVGRSISKGKAAASARARNAAWRKKNPQK